MPVGSGGGVKSVAFYTLPSFALIKRPTCYAYSPEPFVPEVFYDQASPNQREHAKYSDGNRTSHL